MFFYEPDPAVEYADDLAELYSTEEPQNTTPMVLSAENIEDIPF